MKSRPIDLSRGLSRRDMLRGASTAAAGALFVGAARAGSAWAGSAWAGRSLSGPRVTETRLRHGGAVRNLVLVELSGGNDGLSTIVPHGADALYRLRKTTTHKKADLLPLDDFRGFSPKLGNLRAEYDAGRMAIIEGCGYPEAIRSHFKSLEVWHTARHAGRMTGDGWVGRLVGSQWPEESIPETVVHFGGRAPYSLHSTDHPPVALISPTGYRWLGEDDAYAMGGTAICEHESPQEAPQEAGADLSDEALRAKKRHAGRDGALAALRETLDDATASSARVRKAAAMYATDVAYPKSALSGSLRDIAALIEGGVGTRVFSVRLGGFDTHTGQLARHDRLMGGLNGALGAFLKDIRRSEAGKNTLVCVYSEFGRRVAENGSKGHDHGKAAPMLVFGDPVKGGLYGEHPSMDEFDNGDLAFTTDFRSVYATFIDRWFGGTPKDVLGADYSTLGFLG